MTPTPSTFDLHGAVLRIVPQVFETMLSLTVAPGAAVAPTKGERVSGTVGIAGETLSGAIYLHFSEPLARRAAAAILGLDSPDAADTSSVNDVVSELANMIGGGFKSALCDANLPCAMSTPSIVRGPAFVIELPPGLRSENFAFDCHGERLAVEVHLKLD
jgi:CheY-specific phosphatase CheX